MSAAALAALVSTATTGSAAGDPGPAPGALSAAPAAVGQPAPVLGGLLDRAGLPEAGYRDTVGSVVVEARWADVQPTASSFVPAALDRQVEQARAAGLRVKLRVLAGTDSPSWVKERAGTVWIHLTSGAQAGSAVSVPRWWRATYLSDYDGLQARLAARYDGNPTIGQVTLCGPTVQYCEPYLRATADRRNPPSIREAGFTLGADRAALLANLDAGRHWKSTATEVAFNPYQAVRADSSVHEDGAVPAEYMRRFRDRFGVRAVLANYSLSSTRLRRPEYAALYAEQKRLGRPLAYRTSALAKVGDRRAVFEFAISQGASSVELPRGYRAWPARELQGYAARLAANVVRPSLPEPPPPPSGPPSPPSPPSRPGGKALGEITVAAAGDLCGAGAPRTCAASANLVAHLDPARVLTLGDNQYDSGTLREFLGSYDKAWGRFKARTLPAVGNHELRAGSSAPGYCAYFGAAAHCPTRYYATDLGRWTLVALDSNSSAITRGQLAWLDRELAAATAEGDNVLAYFHHPRWASPGAGLHGSISSVKPFWDLLVKHRADLLLNGHDHVYERFARMTGSGVACSTCTGIRQFVVGTGGANPDRASRAPIAGSQARAGGLDGVLALTLKTDGYAWRMVKADGTVDGAVIDSGTQAVNR